MNFIYFVVILIHIICVHPGINGDDNPLLLTPYIERNQLKEALSLSAVKELPNWPNIDSYSGFLTTDKELDNNLFFWFFPSFKNPKTAPLIVWLEGGPGVSSLFSLFTCGPFHVDSGLNVTLKPFHWVQEYSVLYIDNPVGTGFSYTSSESGYARNETSVADNLYEFLRQFYQLFAKYKHNELYVSGQSYAGKYVPALGHRLAQMANESGMNFKGIAVGNGLTDPLNQIKYANVFKTMGLVDERQAQEIREREENIRRETRAKNYLKAMDLWTELVVSKPDAMSYITKTTGYLQVYDMLSSATYLEPPNDIITYMALNSTRHALHVGALEFNFMNATVGQYLREDFLSSVEPELTAIVDRGYKVLFFTGNLDLMVGVDSISGFLESPDWKYFKDYSLAKRMVWKVNENDTEITGYLKSFDNFNHVIIRNAGHCAACDQPRATLDMIHRFITTKTRD